MLNSKRLKDFKDTTNTPISDFFHDLYWKLIGRSLERITLYLSYYKPISRDYDFDSHSIFTLLHHKLSRLERALQNGQAIQEDVDMKALRIAIKLAARLDADDYMASYDRHERKWGKLITWTEPIEGKTSVYWKSRRPNAVTLEEKLQEQDEGGKAFMEDATRSDRDRRNFFNILNKYMRRWWD